MKFSRHTTATSCYSPQLTAAIVDTRRRRILRSLLMKLRRRHRKVPKWRRDKVWNSDGRHLYPPIRAPVEGPRPARVLESACIVFRIPISCRWMANKKLSSSLLLTRWQYQMIKSYILIACFKYPGCDTLVTLRVKCLLYVNTHKPEYCIECWQIITLK